MAERARSFYIRYSEGGQGGRLRIACRLSLEQRLVDPITGISYHPLCTQIAHYFGASLRIRKQPQSGRCDLSKKSNQLVVNDFSRFALMSSKYLDYLDWAEAVRMLVSQQHLTAKGQTVIRLLKQNRNQNRSTFHWDHLDGLH